MRCVVCTSFGPVDQLVVENWPDPECGPRQLRLRVGACGVNFVDGLFVQGRYQIKPQVPFVPGSEVAGVVLDVGDEVTGFAIGDRVMANVGLGGFAEQVVVAAHQAVPIPDTITDTQAATLTQSYCTAWFALRQRCNVEAGQWMLVLGAGGGVGLAACDVGRALGLRVIAAASSEAKLAAARNAGAEMTINSSTDDVKEGAKELAGGGVDIVYDPVGGDLGETCLRALGFDGQFVVIGFASGSIPRLPANQILLRNRRVTGVDWGLWAMENPDRQRALLGEVLDEIVADRLHPIEPATVSLDSASSALEDLLERRAVGKFAVVA